jgi:hypothetical protein
MTELPSRDELERRLDALTRDHLDSLYADEPDGFRIGVVGLIYEVLTPSEPSALRREDAGYTPADNDASYFSYYTSDSRWWMKRAIFGEAGDFYKYPPDEAGKDDDRDGDGDEPE